MRAILFDLDGTLIDTFALYMEAYRRALRPFLGWEPTLQDFLEQRPSSERHFLTAWIGPEDADACHRQMQQHYAELHGALCEGLYDGVREMLAGLRSAGLRLAIVTGKGRGAWEVTRRSLDLGEFDVVVTEDDTPRPKPDPGGIRRALRALGAHAGDAVYIGDSLTDLEAGRQAGTRIGAALWPKTDAEDRDRFVAQIEAARPDWRFERPADVVRTFAAWCGRPPDRSLDRG